jgi:hypothetical protein
MKRFKNIREMAQPKSPEEKRFKDQHSVEVLDPEGHGDDIKPKTKQKKRLADYVNGTDKAAYDKAYTVKKEAVEEDWDAIEAEILENHDISELSEEQLDELIGKIARGIGKGVKKAAKRMSTSGRADAAEKKAAKAEKKNIDRERMKKAKERIAAAKAKRNESSLEEDIADIIVEAYGESLLEFTDEELDTIIDRLHEDLQG